MAKAAHSFGTYLRNAFFRKAPVPGLGAMPLNQMVLGLLAVLGLASPGFWFLGIAAEIGYLTLMAGNPRFQHLVDAETRVGDQRGWYDKVERAVASLGADSRQRYTRLLSQCRRILGISASYDEVSLGTLKDLRGRSLNQMLWIFLRLLRSREVIAENLENLDRGELEVKIAELEGELEKAEGKPSALVRSLGGSLDIIRKRLENLDRAQESLQVIDAELQRIEGQAELLREEAAVSGNPELLSSRLDAVTSTMDETSRWMDAQSDLFSTLGPVEEEGGMELPPAPQRTTEG